MTTRDLRYNVLLGVDSLFEGTAPGYNDKQLSAILNKAQRRVFRDKVKLFDTDEKIKRMLSPTLRRGTLVLGDITATAEAAIVDYPHTITNYVTASFYTLSGDVARIVEEGVYLTKDAVTTGPAIVLPISYDYFTKNYKSRYKKPYVDLVWRMDTKLESTSPTVEIIYPSGYTVADYKISYLKYPVDLVVDTTAPYTNEINCEISDVSFQDEIVGEAIKIITASLNDEGYQNTVIEKQFDN